MKVVQTLGKVPAELLHRLFRELLRLKDASYLLLLLNELEEVATGTVLKNDP
jgi:hypothetical protein